MWIALMPRTGSPCLDSRGSVLHLLKEDRRVFHPGYQKLGKLFRDISYAIAPDYHWAEDTIRQRPDFVHEIL
jgi:hypothetical protein